MPTTNQFPNTYAVITTPTTGQSAINATLPAGQTGYAMSLVTGDVIFGVEDSASSMFITSYMYRGNDLVDIRNNGYPLLVYMTTNNTTNQPNMVLSPYGQTPIQLIMGQKWLLVSIPSPLSVDSVYGTPSVNSVYGFFKFKLPYSTQNNINNTGKPNYNFTVGQVIFGNLGIIARGVSVAPNGLLTTNGSGISESVINKASYPNRAGQNYNVLNVGNQYFIPTEYLKLIAPPIIKTKYILDTSTGKLKTSFVGDGYDDFTTLDEFMNGNTGLVEYGGDTV
jgi:hypothetical protein